MSLPKRIKILLVEDSKLDVELILIELERNGFSLEPTVVYDRAGLDAALCGQPFDLILSDIILPGFSGAEALKVARVAAPDTPFIFVSGIFGEAHAVEMMRLGANDYVLKQSLELLSTSVERALTVVHERRERRKAEEALQTLEVRSRLAIDAARLGMWELQPETNCLLWDERCKAMFDLPSDAQVDLELFARLGHPDEVQKMFDAVRRATEHSNDQEYHAEYRISLPTGGQRWIEARGKAFFEDGICTRLLGVMMDITQQKRATEALEQLNTLLGERVQERTRERDRTWDLSRDLLIVTGSQGRLLALNPAWAETLGWDRQALIDKPFIELVHSDDRSITQAELNSVSNGRITNRFVNRIQHRDGSYRWISWTAVPEDGKLYGSGRDITAEVDAMEELATANRQLREQINERERVEATLQQMQRLEAVGQLTAGVAHDFNNLLTVILSSAAFMGRDLEKGTLEKLPSRLQNVREAGERGAKLIGQLLAFSRRQRLAPKPVELNETVNSMLALLQSTMGGSVWIETSLEPGLWHALVDPTQIELIILNLAINARDAMSVGGSLRLTTANQTITAAPSRPEEPEPGDYVMMSVRDSGTGMTDEVLAKAFEPFFTTKEVGKGSGLGLAQVFGFAKQSGGGVRIETELGVGTEVKVFLPRAEVELDDAASDTQAASESRMDGPRRTILLVDDDSAVREVTSTLLQELGYSVIEAQNGFAALAVIERTAKIDLLLADFAMPGMNGAELARTLRQRQPDLPVVFITGYAELGELDEQEYFIVPKPFRENDLANKVHSALKGSNPLKVIQQT
ncbi:response regulator [Pseudomonas sp. MAG002Y]|uniref:response regulator n=1 Tax=Pseudomonas TaxID=286 RepID=UPI001C60C746|nr:response regulator [Pseudomonas sp. MAG002Y]MBW5413191.1 response regulator [Pseudomonas sp. MAG002Y]